MLADADLPSRCLPRALRLAIARKPLGATFRLVVTPQEVVSGARARAGAAGPAKSASMHEGAPISFAERASGHATARLPRPHLSNGTSPARFRVLPPSGCRSCPFAHPGEHARRRPLDKFAYSAELCAYARRGARCPLGDGCPMAHHSFEMWLHPDK